MTATIRDATFYLARPDSRSIELRKLQGLWTEEQYLTITDRVNELIEFTDGYIEVLPMPTRKHQRILSFLNNLLRSIIRAQGGEVLFAPLRLRVRAEKYREPDLLLLLDANDERNQERFWLGADLVVEIVSSDDPERDTVDKRADYAEAAIPEYWIVNPIDETIAVLVYADAGYIEHGVFGRGATATSPLLGGLTIDVAAVFDAR